MKPFVFFLIFLVSTSHLFGEVDSSVAHLMDAINEAVHNEQFDKALTLIDRGKKDYPHDSRFSILAGKMYMEQKLYDLAREEFEEAERLSPTAEIRFQLSRVHGFLDNNERSAVYLEGLLDDPLYRPKVLTDLGWMYFKLHRLREGEDLMLEALAEGFNRTYAHTLGTIYSGLYEYDKSRHYYLLAVENALASMDRHFAAVAYYNLALLEMGYYHYEKAQKYTVLSLEQVNRSSGHVAMGELSQRSLDFDNARKEYLSASLLNGDSPLALLDLADLYREFGLLDEALVLLGELRNRSDNSWMFYYGINSEEWDRDLTEVFVEVYEGLIREGRVKPRWGIKGWGESLVRDIKYRGWLIYHRGRFRKLCLKLGKNQLEENNPLHGWILMAEGARGYGNTALYYWNQASGYEVGLAPHAASWYNLRKGRELGNRDLLIRANEGFYPIWENSLRSQSLSEQISLLKKGGIGKKEYADFLVKTGELYRLNRGALRQNGVGLPLRIEGQGDRIKGLTRQLYRFHREVDEKNEALCYHLTLIVKEGESSYWYLREPAGTTVQEGRMETAVLDRKERRELINRVEESLYGVGL
jgi:tetratricopeptide (TPR) repeat protein